MKPLDDSFCREGSSTNGMPSVDVARLAFMVDADVELLVDDEDFLCDNVGMDARPGVDELIE